MSSGRHRCPTVGAGVWPGQPCNPSVTNAGQRRTGSSGPTRRPRSSSRGTASRSSPPLC